MNRLAPKKGNGLLRAPVPAATKNDTGRKKKEEVGDTEAASLHIQWDLAGPQPALRPGRAHPPRAGRKFCPWADQGSQAFLTLFRGRDMLPADQSFSKHLLLEPQEVACSPDVVPLWRTLGPARSHSMGGKPPKGGDCMLHVLVTWHATPGWTVLDATVRGLPAAGWLSVLSPQRQHSPPPRQQSGPVWTQNWRLGVHGN